MMEEKSGSHGGHRSSSTVAVLILLVVLLVAVLGGLWSALMQQPAPPERVPAQIAGLRLTRTVTGPEALSELRQMHGKDIPLTGGYVAHYEKGAFVWVGDTGNGRQAEDLFNLMAQRIGAGSKVFANLRLVQIGGTDLYSVDGQGQQHFFYARGNAVIWVAVPVGSADAFILDALSLIEQVSLAPLF